MAMTLRLNETDTAALRAYAEAHGKSMQEAAQEAIRALTHEERSKQIMARILAEDGELLHRLAQ
jgi:plasmid stability protein